MQVKITRTTVANKQFVLAGQVYDLPDADARMLLQLGKAVTIEAVEAVEAPPAILDTVAADALVETDAPKAKRSRRAK
jgi:hypothetical protein